TYAAIRDDVERVVGTLGQLAYLHQKDPKGLFSKVRSWEVDRIPDASCAAWFIYLNRTCFNGLYRVNKEGRFNVPFGDYTSPLILDEPNLRAVSASLQDVEVVHRDFEILLDMHARKGDLVYCDPPYVPLSKTSSFTSYSTEGFTQGDQERLVDA